MKKLDRKYNIPNIQIFLSVFDLSLEEKEEFDESESLQIYMEDLEVGTVHFGEDEIIMNTLSKYGELECKTNYAEAFTLTDVESFQTIGQLGLYASWNNTFDFKMHLLNGTVFRGNLLFGIKIDNEFGNRVTPHFKLEYTDGEKKYDIQFQENGFPFRFIEKRGTFEEQISYSLFDYLTIGSYMHHSKQDQFSDGSNVYDYYESAFISSCGENNTAITHKEFDKRWIVHNYSEFGKIANDSEEEEIINKARAMHFVDPSTRERLYKLIEEFSVEGSSFIEKLFVYGFSNYSEKEVYSLFGINKNNIDLETLYFGTNDLKSLGSKIFTPNK